ncbi:hypothetical protein OCL06_02260 [Alteromonas sp. ASW11-19]|uniref:DUF560 domain-containing protein n=1 Tax=Alteromonas salexigens TaxID=2982530 RepID=A0ABT2VKT5_9ALTE|nr:hypothetical protein [Alteromonas salexigens]MCU7553418.1 hypothetical protein [Alteromonas salexigens]
MRKSIVCSLSLLAAAGVAPLSANETLSFSGEVFGGYGYDDNVSVNELETSTREGDSAWHYGAAGKATFTPAKKWQFTAGAKHQATRYQQQEDFDLAITTLSATGSYQADGAKVGAHHYYADAQLGDSGFMTYSQSGMSLGRGFAEGSGYWRTSLDHINKTFDTLSERDATAKALRTDAFWFFDASQFIQLGVVLHDEDAEDEQFSYQSPTLSVAYQHPVSIFSKQAKIDVSYSYSHRQYTATELQPEREDHRRKTELTFTLPLASSLDISLAASHGNYQSTNVSADYQETKTELEMRWAF